jgi:hypothetical protein
MLLKILKQYMDNIFFSGVTTSDKNEFAMKKIAKGNQKVIVPQ